MGRPGYRWSQFKKQARQRRVGLHIAQHDHAALVARSCVYCGTRPSPTCRIGVDRIDSARPYELGNCVPSCAPCNYMKNTLPLQTQTFLNRVRRIARRHPAAPSDMNETSEGSEGSEASEVSEVSEASEPGVVTARAGLPPSYLG